MLLKGDYKDCIIAWELWSWGRGWAHWLWRPCEGRGSM